MKRNRLKWILLLLTLALCLPSQAQDIINGHLVDEDTGENIGFAKPKKEGLYNILIMEEVQSILALGAGGISKIWFPAENRLERVANVSNYEIYIDRIDEMIERKKQGFFGQNR